MAIINIIKQRIRMLEAGSFQNLCDHILSNMGYDNLVSLGSQAGTQKTTKGTPDTYCIVDEDKYVFIEYTTQDTRLFQKIKDDIEKCIDEKTTGIETSRIAEILYFHTSSNLTPKQDDEIKTICKEKGVILSIFGVDWIAFNLYRQNRALAKEYLNIQIDNNQIFEIDDFIKQNSASGLAAPLDNEFLFRSEELNDIDDVLQKHDVVVLVGQAGAGKTRLAIEYTKKRIKKSKEKVFCIRDNALSIYEDLNLYIGSPGDYLLVVDDANQISGLSHILYYLTQKSKGISVKIIITVRDYALNDVRRKIIEYTTFNPVMINLFSNDEIVDIVKSALGINNQQYLDRIAEISNGNARIAMIAGKTAIQEENLLSLSDVSTLYESYYGNAIQKVGLSANKHLLVAFGITAFVNSFHMDLLDYLGSVFEASNISKDDFLECIYQLHSFEFVDICNDKAVKISEQCLSNYILKYVFYDKKLVSLSSMIKAYFPINQSQTISSVNGLLKLFYSEQMKTFVESEIKTIWDDLSKIDSNQFFEFVKVFYPINETSTLQLLKQKIDNTEKIGFDENVIKTRCYGNDDIITILSGFYGCDNYSLAIELFLMYYQKRPDLYQYFFEAIKQNLVFNEYSEINDYQIEKELIKLIREYSKDWTDGAISYLFIDVAKLMLGFRFERVESSTDHKFTISYVVLHSGDSIIAWRKQVWNYLLESKNNPYFRKSFRKILRDYGQESDAKSSPIIQADCVGVYKIISECLNKHEVNDCIAVDNFVSYLIEHDLKDCIEPEIVDEYLNSEQLYIYKMLIGVPLYLYKNFDDEIVERKEKISALIENANFTMIKNVINICKNEFYDEEYRVKQGLEIFFEVLFENNNHFLDAVLYYLLSDTPLNISRGLIVKHLFQLMDEKELFDFISSIDYYQKNDWLFTYFYLYPEEMVDENLLKNFYAFLLDNSDKDIHTTSFRDVIFISKFNSVSKDAFINCCNIIYRKKSYNPRMVSIYFNYMFHNRITPVEKVLDLFASDMGLLENIYFFEANYEQCFDYEGYYFMTFAKIDKCFIYRFFATMLSQSEHFHISDYKMQINKIYEFDDYLKVFEKLSKMIVDLKNFYRYELKEFFKILIKFQNKGKTNDLVLFFINSYYTDENYMHCLFDAIAGMTDNERILYLKAFLSKTLNIDMFKKIPVISESYSWSGSLVPVIEREREFIIKLNHELHGLVYLDHKQYLEDKEKQLDDYIKEVEIREYIRGH